MTPFSKQTVRHIGIILVLSLAFGMIIFASQRRFKWKYIFLREPAKKQKQIYPIVLGDVLRLQKSPKTIIVDPRLPHLFATAHINGAINIPFPANKLPEPLKKELLDAKYIIIYSIERSNKQSIAVAKLLIKNKIKRVFIYPKGWSEWRNSGLPIVQRGKK
jgi:rhodanese-related sulfurtransferase